VRQLLSYENGIRTYFETDTGDDWTLRYEFDSVEPELEASKELAKDDARAKQQIRDGFWHYAHIPDALLLKWHTEGVNIRDQAELFKKVNSRDYRYLKCTGLNHGAR
jgi:hypothetical protein